MQDKYFNPRPKVYPKIYVYEIPEEKSRKGLLKIGYTTGSAKKRIKDQVQTSGVKYNILLEKEAIRNDGTTFLDHEVHSYLRRKGFRNPDGEWFDCKLKDIEGAILAIKNRQENIENRIWDFKMRPEQKRAVEKTFHYFKSSKETSHFLWNAKMRFGKSFASYHF
jgi:hypothetical protein